MATKTLLYNVSKPVGRSCPNAGDDVLLVRFFLRRISQAGDVMGPYSDMPLRQAYDPELSEAILWFQRKVVAAHHPAAQDGRVDPAPYSPNFYTIRHLNATYRKRYPQFEHSIESDPMFPAGLRSSFSTAKP